jgi:hypothetical protein
MMNDNQSAATLTDDELRAAIAKLEANDDLGALLILQDEIDGTERRKLVLHAIWRLYARMPRSVKRRG